MTPPHPLIRGTTPRGVSEEEAATVVEKLQAQRQLQQSSSANTSGAADLSFGGVGDAGETTLPHLQLNLSTRERPTPTLEAVAAKRAELMLLEEEQGTLKVGLLPI